MLQKESRGLRSARAGESQTAEKEEERMSQAQLPARPRLALEHECVQ